jgi:hypothetical protein
MLAADCPSDALGLPLMIGPKLERSMTEKA